MFVGKLTTVSTGNNLNKYLIVNNVNKTTSLCDKLRYIYYRLRNILGCRYMVLGLQKRRYRNDPTDIYYF